MIETIRTRLYGGLNSIRENKIAILCVLLAVSILASPVVAQEQVDVTDDFENGNVDGWTGENFQISSESIEGQYSLQANNGVSSQSENPEWTSGPTLDLSEQFTVTGTSRIVQDSNTRSGFGIVRQTNNGAEGVILLFSTQYDATFIATGNLEDPDSNGLQQIQDTFNNEWVNWELNNDGSGNIQAKVWESGTTEPTEYQISRQLSQDSGKFSIFSGVGAANRDVNLDSVTLEGTRAPSENLVLDTGPYMDYGETQDYTVYDLIGEAELRENVSANATVVSQNTSVVTVNQGSNTLSSTTDESVNERVLIEANYDNRTAIQPVTVAEPTITNLDILPFMYRLSAMFTDRAFQMILTALLLSIAATRVGGVFSGLGIYQISLTAGWLIGWVPIGLALTSLFATLFIGLNIAANIDYTVRR